MRRGLALSALFHGGLLLALIYGWGRAERPRARAVVLSCEGAAEPAAEIVPPEPDPADPPREAAPEERLEIPEEEERADSVDWPDDIEASVPSPEAREADVRQLSVRLRSPLRDPRRRPPPTPPAVVRRVPDPPAVTRAVSAPVLSGTPASIPYPRRARRRGLEGTVELKLLVDRTGRVTRVVVVRSSGHAVLDEAAKAGVARWRFAPALRNGVPVAAWTRRTVRFRLVPDAP